MNQTILHIDMNSYFASVEQQANPFLRGKPVGVCAYLSPNGCIIASSIEAKKLGIKTGIRVRDAQAIYPKIILVENEPAKYRTVTEKIFSILSEYTDRMEPYSIDEAFLDLTGWVNSLCHSRLDRESKFWIPAFAGMTNKSIYKQFHNAYHIALEIKRRIQQEVGDYLKCSIGISWTKWLAKFASDIAEKDSIFVLTPELLEETFSRVKLTDGWGIKKRMEARLNQLGIFTLNGLKNYPVSNILQSLGKHGYSLWANANGIELGRGVLPYAHILPDTPAGPKSIGHQYALAKKTTDLKFLQAILMKLCEKTGRRLRAKNMQAKNISAYLGYVSGGGIFQTKKTSEPLFTTSSIYSEAKKILFSHPLPARARIIAVSVSNFSPLHNQLSFFQNSYKYKKVSQAMDAINNAFGEFTIASGEMFNMEKFAKDRIGFRKIE